MKDLLIRSLHHEKVERAPWVPFAGVHAAYLKGYTATEMLTDADKAVESLLEVNRLYKPDGQPVIFDLQIEAECLGCDLTWADDCPPSVSSHPLDGSDEEPAEVPCDCKIPQKTSGRIPYVLEVMHRMKEAVGDTTALYGLICGPFTLASHLRGNNLFTDMYDFEDEVADLFTFCKKVCIRMADYYMEAGMDVIAMVDPLISQISTDHFQQFMAEPYTEIFDHIRKAGGLSSFFVCGDATRNIEAMCQTNPDSISVDENVNLLAAKEIVKQIPQAIFLLVGGKSDDIPIEQLIAQNNLTGKFMITGEVKDAIRYANLFDIAVLTSRWEGFGLVLPEYMLAKCPIVAFDVDAVGESVENEINGLLVRPNDTQQLADSIIRLFRDEKLRTQLGENGYIKALRQFDMKRVCQEHENLFCQLLDH